MAETNVHTLEHLFTHLVSVLLYLVSGDCDFTVFSSFKMSLNNAFEKLLALGLMKKIRSIILRPQS